jgi:hypothetical protein
MSLFDGFERRDALMGAEHFALVDRPSLTFRFVRYYNAAGFIPSVIGVTVDGTRQTAARVADVVPVWPSKKV